MKQHRGRGKQKAPQTATPGPGSASSRASALQIPQPPACTEDSKSHHRRPESTLAVFRAATRRRPPRPRRLPVVQAPLPQPSPLSAKCIIPPSQPIIGWHRTATFTAVLAACRGCNCTTSSFIDCPALAAPCHPTDDASVNVKVATPVNTQMLYFADFVLTHPSSREGVSEPARLCPPAAHDCSSRC